jgi:hypothetical protein
MDYYSNHIQGTPVYGMSDEAWGKEQAANCHNIEKGDQEGIVFLDIESTTGGYAPKIQEVQSRVHRIARAFLEEIDRLSGKKNGMYIAVGWLDWYPIWFRDRPLWVAWYNIFQTIKSVLARVVKNGWTGRCLMWQFSSREKVTGIKGNVDGNGWIGSDQDYVDLFGGTIGPAVTPEDTKALYSVKVLINNLSVRSGPMVLHKWLRRADFPGEYSIYEERGGYGRISESVSEWISLSSKYVQVIK